MSRHRLTPLPEYEGYEIVIGWDRRLGSYFAQMYCLAETEDAADTPQVWLGADEPITDPATAIEALRPYTQIPAHLHAELKANCAREGSHHDHAEPAGSARTVRRALLAALDQLQAAMSASDAEQAAYVIHRLINDGYAPLLAHILEAMIDNRLRNLTDRQLTEAYGAGQTLYGITITSSAGLHIAIAAPDRTILGMAAGEGVHPRDVMAAIGYGPERYAYRSYGTDGPAELFSLTPIQGTS